MTSLLSISSIWALAFVLAKIGIFAGLVAGAGGVLALGGYHNGSRAAHTRLLSYSLLGAFIGFHSSLAPVLIQAGQIKDAGVMGMFDSDLVLLLRGTPAWESAAFRGAGFALSGAVDPFIAANTAGAKKAARLNLLSARFHRASASARLRRLRLFAVWPYLCARRVGAGQRWCFMWPLWGSG